jgi:hypothetical protein
MIKKFLLLITLIFVSLKGVCTASSNESLLAQAEALREEGKHSRL